MILASPKVLKFLVGILRAKLIAVFLGLTGAGIINQLQTTIRQIATFTLTSLPEGMIKLIAEENGIKIDIEKIAKIIKTYLTILIPLTLLVTFSGYIFADEITLYVFGDIKFKLYFQIGFVALPISILSTSSFALLKAFKEIKFIAYAEVLIILLNLILFIPLIYFYKITGAVIYVTLTFFITFFVYYSFMKKNVFKKHNITFKSIRKAIISVKYMKELGAFMGFGLVAGTYFIFMEITTRSIVVNELGIKKLGVYAPITAWASLFIGFILPSLNTYLFPRLSEAKNDKDITAVVNDVVRLMTFATLPFVIIGISTREWLIPLFYSKDFMEASVYLPFHFSALLFTIWTFSFKQIFAPTGRLKKFLIFAIINHSLSLGLVYFLVPKLGLFGYLSKFTITPVFTAIVFYLFWKNEIKFKLKKENIKVVLYAILCVILLLLMRDIQIYLQLLAVVLLLPLFFLLKKEEKDYFLKKIKRN